MQLCATGADYVPEPGRQGKAPEKPFSHFQRNPGTFALRQKNYIPRESFQMACKVETPGFSIQRLQHIVHYDKFADSMYNLVYSD